MKNTLLEEMKHASLDSITVFELTEKADVNRKTFYNHFTGINDLIGQIIIVPLRRIAEGASRPEIQQKLKKEFDHYCLEFVRSAVEEMTKAEYR